MASLFEINIGQTQDFESILKKASNALMQISLQGQQAKPAGPAVTRPAIARPTELASPERLNTFLAEQFAAAKEKRSGISVLLLTLDETAHIEATFGKATREAAEQFTGLVVCAAARPGDLPARLNNETVALVMAGGDRNADAALADKIRKAIHARPLPVGGESVRLTASIGLASFLPGSPFRAADHLLKAAAASLAAASRTQNCVKIFSLPVPPPAKAA